MLAMITLVASLILLVTKPEKEMTNEEIDNDYYSDLRELRTM